MAGIATIFKIKFPCLATDELIKLNLPIIDNTVYLRNNSIDRRVFTYVFYSRWHQPIPEVTISNTPVIVDLGTNIGLSVITFKHWYPEARIIGYEMDRENFELAKKNTISLQNVHLVNKAIHHKSTNVSYEKSGREDAYTITPHKQGFSAITVEAITMSDVLVENNIKMIDYLKMDIEGAELDIMSSADLSWLKKVRNINIEFHLKEDRAISKYIGILEEIGFKVYVNTEHWASITAINLAK